MGLLLFRLPMPRRADQRIGSRSYVTPLVVDEVRISYSSFIYFQLKYIMNALFVRRRQALPERPVFTRNVSLT